jgi:hypothetical protein
VASRRPAILLLAYFFPPAIASGGARADRFAKYLSRLGYDIRVICARDGTGCQYEYAVEVPLPEQRSSLVAAKSWMMRALQSAIRVYSWRLPWVPHALAASRTFMENRPVVISTFPPLATHLCALYLKWRYGIRWIADFRDPVLLRPSLRFLQEPLEKMVFRFSDVVIANTDPAAASWRACYPKWSSKVQVIWNGFDPEETLEPANVPCREQKVLAHVGDIYGPRHPGLVLDSLERLVASGRLDAAKVRIELIGPIDSDSATFKHASFHRLKEMGCVQVYDQLIPRADALRKAAHSDGLLLLDITNLERGVQVPAKLFDYVRMGRPILAVTGSGSPTEMILLRSGVQCVCIHPQDQEAEVDNKLLSFLKLQGETSRVNEWFRRTFDGLRQVEFLASIVDGVSASPVGSFAEGAPCSEEQQ